VDTKPTEKGALNGIRVLDLSRVLAAPFAGQMLGDLGADVIKVERPVVGDDARRYGFSSLTDAEGKRTLESSFYLCANRNKRAITCDLTKPEGQDIVRELARNSDVIIENYKVGDLKRYGLDYESLRPLNPGMIYCSVTGFGQSGPSAPQPGFDGLFQTMGGMMAVTGIPEGRPGAGPLKAGPSLIDVFTGHNATAAILAASISTLHCSTARWRSSRISCRTTWSAAWPPRDSATAAMAAVRPTWSARATGWSTSRPDRTDIGRTCAG
jgi:crotonobetainyl-CoA:carnitine CoA-transferase CaiB-like acyl-CoA transferase